jgi:hypothetical protein
VEKMMIANKKNLVLNQEATMEEELLKRSSAPTVLDLRAALKDLFADVEAELDSPSPDDGFPQQPD